MTSAQEARVIVIVPTYNEEGNIKKLARSLFSLGIPHLSLIIVDDHSIDSTANMVRILAREFPITLIEREKKLGLGTAYIAGFQRALQMSCDIIIQMDGDLSHDPHDIPRFLESIASSDVVLGSRYVSGGGSLAWSARRQALSRLSNLYARTMLGLPYHDITSGFKCFRREALATISFDRFISVGYVFQVETIYRAHRLGLRITEMPIIFHKREAGRSKLTLHIVFESFWKIFKLRLHG
ncbi:MAG: polyprenol monophosphomannose synthase [Patescibacteria group bacterium]